MHQARSWLFSFGPSAADAAIKDLNCSSLPQWRVHGQLVEISAPAQSSSFRFLPQLELLRQQVDVGQVEEVNSVFAQDHKEVVQLLLAYCKIFNL